MQNPYKISPPLRTVEDFESAPPALYMEMMPGWIVKSWSVGANIPKLPEQTEWEDFYTVQHHRNTYLLRIPKAAQPNKIKAALRWWFSYGNQPATLVGKNKHYIVRSPMGFADV